MSEDKFKGEEKKLIKLDVIKDTLQGVVESISKAVNMEIEIVSYDHEIVAGTGRYYDRIGKIEPCGEGDSEEIYCSIFRTGKSYVVEDALHHQDYWGHEKELAEICCPIVMDGDVIGIIGLVAFTEEQQEFLIKTQNILLNFTETTAYLIAGKLKEMTSASGMRIMLEAVDRGILCMSNTGTIIECNEKAERLLGEDRSKILGQNIDYYIRDEFILNIIKKGITCKGVEFRSGPDDRVNIEAILDVYPIELENDFVHLNIHAGVVLSMTTLSSVRRLMHEVVESGVLEGNTKLVGKSKSIEHVKSKISKITRGKSSVLITGQSGTGKSVVARIIHESGKRKNKPFVVVNCAAIPASLVESELFGYEAGAFTGANKKGKLGKFEIADGGTIFLDEIGDMPLNLQGKILHVLQSGRFVRVGGTKEIEVDVRVISATNRDLLKMVREKEFREDLYFRLNVIPIVMPPLKQRKDDIPLLLNNALEKINKNLGKDIGGFTEEAMEALVRYDWPGNVRELENVVEYALNMEEGYMIRIDSLPEQFAVSDFRDDEQQTLENRCKALEKHIIEQALKKEGYSAEDKKRVAEKLGIGEATLYRKIKSLGIYAKNE